jgi:flagellar protein FliO/FliZ
LNTLLKVAAGCSLAATAGLAAASSEPAMPVVSTLVSLLVVLAAIGATALVVKHVGRGFTSEARLMRVVSQLSLGAREKISVVEFEDQWLVLGVTSQQITLLAQTARKESAVAAPQAVSFSKIFSLARGKHDAS